MKNQLTDFAGYNTLSIIDLLTLPLSINWVWTWIIIKISNHFLPVIAYVLSRYKWPAIFEHPSFCHPLQALLKLLLSNINSAYRRVLCEFPASVINARHWLRFAINTKINSGPWSFNILNLMWPGCKSLKNSQTINFLDAVVFYRIQWPSEKWPGIFRRIIKWNLWKQWR